MKLLLLLGISFVFLNAFSERVVAVKTAHLNDSLLIYTGKYKFPEGTVIKEADVVLENEVLKIVSSMGSATLEQKETDVFTIVEYNGIATFIRNEKKEVSSIKLSVMNMVMEGKKE